MFRKENALILLFRFLFQNECFAYPLSFYAYPFSGTLFLSYHWRKFWRSFLHDKFKRSNYYATVILYAGKNDFQIQIFLGTKNRGG